MTASSPALPKGLGIAPQWGAITPYEEELADKTFREEIGTDAYVEMLDAPKPDDNLVSASHTGAGGTVRADIRLEGPDRNLIREVLITGDFFVTPPRLVFDLEAALRGLDVDDCRRGRDAVLRAYTDRAPEHHAGRFPQGGRDGACPADRGSSIQLTTPDICTGRRLTKSSRIDRSVLCCAEVSHRPGTAG